MIGNNSCGIHAQMSGPVSNNVESLDVLTYDGTPYNGWQIQPNLPTIQGTLANVIHHITGESVLPQGSGRTDAGGVLVFQELNEPVGHWQEPERAGDDAERLGARCLGNGNLRKLNGSRHIAGVEMIRCQRSLGGNPRLGHLRSKLKAN